MTRLPARDAPHAANRVVYAMDGLADSTIAGIEAALSAYVARPGSVEFRRALGRRHSSTTHSAGQDRATRLADAVAAAVIHLDEDLTLTELALRARRHSYGLLPTQILISRGRVVVSVSHAAMDGGPILEYVVWLLTAAAGSAAKRDDRTPVRFPMLRGLRSAGLGGVRAFRRDREDGRSIREDRRQAVSRVRDLSGELLSTLALTPEALARVAALPVSSPVTLSARIVSIALAAIRHDYAGDAEIPVTVPIDLRRFVANGRVAGNFIGDAGPAGFLRSDWSAEAVTGRFGSATSSGSAMVSGVYAVTRWHLQRARAVLGRGTDRSSTEVASMFVPVLSVRRALPRGTWRMDGTPVIAVVPLGARVTAMTSVTVLTIGPAVHVTLWDETGLFDVHGFGAAFENEVQRRAATPVRAEFAAPTAVSR